MENKMKRPFYKKWWVWLLVLVGITIALTILGFFLGEDDPSQPADNNIFDIEDDENEEDVSELPISAQIEQYIENTVNELYRNTDIDSITVNENLGTDDPDDFIVLLNLTWNVKNSGQTSKEMIEMYSSDFAARIYSERPEIQEIAMFWSVPYLNGEAKVSYEREMNGMALSDKIFDNTFN